MFDLFAPINKHCVYPLYYFKNGDKRLERLAQLEKQQYFSPEALQALQLEKLQSLIRYAYDHTRYYRRVMDERGVKPEDIKQLNDIEHLPILTKQVIQDNLDDLISSKFTKDQLVKDASGGSTGEPTHYFKDWDRHNLRSADQIRHDRWCGWDIGKRKAIIWGAQRDLKSKASFKEHILARYIARQWELNAFDMSPKEMDHFTGQLKKIRPSMILGYANALVVYAEYLLKNKPDHGIVLDGIISSAETLTSEKKQIIEKAFKCTVLNRYGSREVGLIASECKVQHGLHINADNLLLEILNKEKPVPIGERGNIVITDFSNFGMPFIRYNLGDIGYLHDKLCSCGRGLPLLRAVEGRSGDFFVSNTGKLVHGEYFTHLFYDVPSVKKFQMIQESLDYVQLNIVEASDRGNRDYIPYIESKVKEMLGNQSHLNVSFVEDIPPTASGKFLFTISKLSHN